MQLIDSHCRPGFRRPRRAPARSACQYGGKQVAQALAISVSRESFEEVLAIAQAHDNIYASVGVH